MVWQSLPSWFEVAVSNCWRVEKGSAQERRDAVTGEGVQLTGRFAPPEQLDERDTYMAWDGQQRLGKVFPISQSIWKRLRLGHCRARVEESEFEKSGW